MMNKWCSSRLINSSVLEVIGLYSVDGKSKPSMMFDNVAARAGVV
jgi:hypothetical protein